MKPISRNFFLLIVAFSISSCASQKPPTGGPGDKAGPKLLEQFPANGTTSFDGKELYFGFNEFLNRKTVSTALSIEPDLGIQPDISMGRKSFKIRFRESLPSNTTIIVKLGSELKDTFGNSIEKPITLAFSTGDQIDQGTLSGAIYKAEDGKGESGRKVFLYPEGMNPLESPAKYVVETDTGGVFRFQYLADGFYQALWMEDTNRDRKLNPDREIYSTFYQSKIYVSADSMALLEPIYTSLEDTLKPTLFETGLFTTNRLNLQFSENVVFDEQTRMEIEDSLGVKSPAYALYTTANNESILLVHSVKPLDNEQMQYRINVDGIMDQAGNRNSFSGGWFDGTNQKDSVLQRIVPYGIKEEYFYNDTLEFRYAKPFVANSAVADSFFVNTPSAFFKPWTNIQASQNVLRIAPDSLWLDESTTFNLWDPFDLSFAAYNPQIWTPNELGELEIDFSGFTADSSSLYQIRVFDDKNTLYYRGQFQPDTAKSRLRIERLPAKNLRITVYEDKNLSGNFEMGDIRTTLPPKRYFFLPSADIRSGFITEIKIDFSQAIRNLMQRFAKETGNTSNMQRTNENELELQEDIEENE